MKFFRQTTRPAPNATPRESCAAEAAAARPPVRRLPFRRRLAYAALIDMTVLGLVAVAGEITCRLFAPQADYSVMRDSDMTLHRFSDDIYLGFELRPGLADHNAAGFRGREVSRAKPPGVWRVAVLGDSVTYGLGVKADEAFPALLERRLNDADGSRGADCQSASPAGRLATCPTEVLNFGVPAYGTFQEYTLLGAKVLDYDPDMVITVLSPDDTETSPVILDIDGQMCLFRNQFEGVALLNNRLHWGLVRHSHLYRLLYKRAVLALSEGRGRFDDVYQQPDVAWQNVRRAESLCRAGHQQFLLVLSPLLKPHYYPADLSDPNLSGREMLLEPDEVRHIEEGLDRIRQLAAEAGTEMLDLGSLYEERGAAMKHSPIDHEHLGPEGHWRVAEALAERISAMKTSYPEAGK